VAPSLDYSQLVALDRSRLHVFIAGPGQGEAVAIALPGKGWIFVDSCRAAQASNGTDLPLVSIVRRFRRADEPIEALILTHPHRDHSEGFAEFVDDVKPARLGIVGPLAPDPNLLDQADEWIASQPRTTGIDRAKLGAVKGALAAVREWTRAHPGALLVLRDAVLIPTPNSPAKVTAIAPDGPVLQALWAKLTVDEKFSKCANQSSLVLLVKFGATEVVLGGDLPHTHGGTVVTTGWSKVSQSYPTLSEHHAMKVPHHGSLEALHVGWMGTEPRDRCWCVSPYNSSSLPGLAEGEGIDQMLAVEKSIRLTAVPAARSVQTAHPTERIALGQLGFRRDRMRTGLSFIDNTGIDIKPGTAVGPNDCVWVLQFNDASQLTESWRGSAALVVERNPPPPPPGVVVRRRPH
jgi:hypothetical protein